VLAALSWQFCSGSCPESPVMAVLFCLSSYGFLFLAVLSWLAFSGCQILSRQPHPACPVLLVLYCLSCSAVLFLQSRSVCPILPILFCLSYSACPVQPVQILPALFCLSSFSCSLLPVLFCLSSLDCPLLSGLFCLSYSAHLFCSACHIPVLS
jgi:hypothetical protein